MASFINTNIASLNAQRNLASSQSALQTSLQRLSSGLRINSAKDDAAGLAIANRFTTQINGLDQAQRNANDGISLAQTADGALSSISDNLQRIRELAVQAANSTNSASDRAAINEEVQQRLAEIDRTSSQTSFNGQKILDGNFGTASFQVGANAGETINVDLNSSMRTGAIGKIATETTTGAVGATASGGTITTGTITAGNFSIATAAQVDGHNTVSPASMVFNQTASSQVNGSNTSVTFSSAFVTSKFDASGLGATPGFNAQTFTSTGTVTDGTGSTVSALDFSGTHLAQFDVSAASINGGNPIGITLNQSYADTTALVGDVQSQLNAVTGGSNDFVVSYSSGQLRITSSAGTSADAVSISNVDANAASRGMVDSSGAAGVAAGAGISFTVDGTAVSLSSDYSNVGANTAQQSADAMAADIASQLASTGDGYTVTIDGTTGAMSITHAGTAAGDTNAVAITAADSAAQSVGVMNDTGTAGSLATSTGTAKFLVDGTEVVLNSDYSGAGGGYAQMATDIQSQLTGYTANYDSSTGSLTISKDGSLAAVAITTDTAANANEQANATNAGFVNSAGTAGTAATTSTALSFNVDGQAITLSGDDSGGLSAVQADLQSQLDTAFGSGAYTAAVSGSGLSITNTIAGSSAVTLDVGSSGNAYDAGFRDATGTDGATGGSVAISNLSITVGSNSTVNIAAKTYASVDDLAAEINKSVGGAYATVSNGKLSLTSASAMTLGGSDATALGFASNTIAANDGSLDSGDTLTVDNANSLIQRVDSALGSVNSLRSTFGAIQNRFDSVISNLSSTSENLSAARSRIQDADFAAETASLTRGQILQQAGTAMLAQANSLPNNVLSLLR